MLRISCSFAIALGIGGSLRSLLVAISELPYIIVYVTIGFRRENTLKKTHPQKQQRCLVLQRSLIILTFFFSFFFFFFFFENRTMFNQGLGAVWVQLMRVAFFF